MLTGIPKDELTKILKSSSMTDLRILELKLVPGRQHSKTRRETIDSIVTCASQPSDVLRQQRLRKSVIRRYLWSNKIPVTQDQSKGDYIRICLDLWQAADDDYVWKFRTDDEIAAAVDHFGENMKEGLNELKRRLRERRPSPKELANMKRSMDKMLEALRTFGTAPHSPVPQSPGQATAPPASRSPSHDDSDSSNLSSSSVEVLEETSSSTQSMHIDDLSLTIPSAIPFSMDFSESSSWQPASAAKSSDVKPLFNTSKPSSSQTNTIERSPSKSNAYGLSSSELRTSDELAEGPPSSEQRLQNTPPSAHPATTHSFGTPQDRSSATANGTPVTRDTRQLFQTILSKYFSPHTLKAPNPF